MSITREQKKDMLRRQIAELNDTSVDCMMATYELQHLDLEDALSASVAENIDLRRDRERLEAVAANGWRLSCEFGANGHPNHWICYDKDWSRPEGEGTTFNAAIDAAIGSAGGERKP